MFKGFEDLPTEVLSYLAHTLPTNDLFRFRYTCDKLRDVADDVLYGNISRILFTTKWVLLHNHHDLVALTVRYIFQAKFTEQDQQCAMHEILIYSIRMRRTKSTIYLLDIARLRLSGYLDTFRHALILQAAEESEITVLRALIIKKGDSEMFNENGNTLAHYYASGRLQDNGGRATELMKHLLPIISHTFAVQNNKGIPPLTYALIYEKVDQFRWLLPKCNPNISFTFKGYNAPLLLLAADLYHRTRRETLRSIIIALLKDTRTNINVVDDEGSTILHLGIDEPSMLEVLLQRPEYDPNLKDHRGCSILRFRVASGLCIQRLCDDPRTNLNEVNERGESILHCAAQMRSLAVMDTLVMKMPSLVNQRNNARLTALHYSVQTQCVAVLAKMVSMPDVDLDARTLNGRSALLMAAYDGWTAGVIQLSKVKGINTYAIDSYGNNALHLRIQGFNIDIYEGEDCLKALLDLPMEKNLQNHEGKTPLILATCMRNRNAVKVLLASGCDASIIDNTGKTARQYAVGMKGIDLLPFLEIKGSKRKRC